MQINMILSMEYNVLKNVNAFDNCDINILKKTWYLTKVKEHKSVKITHIRSM